MEGEVLMEHSTLLTRQVGLGEWHSRAFLVVAEGGVEFMRVCVMPCAHRLPKQFFLVSQIVSKSRLFQFFKKDFIFCPGWCGSLV